MADSLHNLLPLADDAPLGMVLPYPGDQIPTGWLLFDGSTLNEKEYPELSALLRGAEGIETHWSNMGGSFTDEAIIFPNPEFSEGGITLAIKAKRTVNGDATQRSRGEEEVSS